MKSEVGSEFWSVPLSEKDNSIFSGNVNWFVSGRSALYSIIADIKKQYDFRTVALPDWCCESMIRPFLDAGIEVQFFPAVGSSFCINADVLLLMDYFGYVGSGSRVENFTGIIIRDVTHSLFSANYADADYYFGSLRKWAGFWTGGFAWGFRYPISYETGKAAYVELRKQAMKEKDAYLSGNHIGEKKFLKMFSDSEAMLDGFGIHPADERDIRYAHFFDIDRVRERRHHNASLLLESLAEEALFPNIGENDCPLFVPILAEKRDELRQYLIQRKIYCPVHWPVSKYHCISTQTKRLYEQELSLVCDQRYNDEDMYRICSAIKEFFKR